MQQQLAECALHEMGRRSVPPLTPVPIVMGEEPWRERLRYRARNLTRRASAGSLTPQFLVIGYSHDLRAVCPDTRASNIASLKRSARVVLSAQKQATSRDSPLLPSSVGRRSDFDSAEAVARVKTSRQTSRQTSRPIRRRFAVLTRATPSGRRGIYGRS